MSMPETISPLQAVRPTTRCAKADAKGASRRARKRKRTPNNCAWWPRAVLPKSPTFFGGETLTPTLASVLLPLACAAQSARERRRQRECELAARHRKSVLRDPRIDVVAPPQDAAGEVPHPREPCGL